MQLQILLISIRSTDEQFYRMGSLAWLGYLSYTQVVESSNLSPSILSTVLYILLASKSTWLFLIQNNFWLHCHQDMVPRIHDTNRESCSSINLVVNHFSPANLSIILPIHFVVLFNRSILANSFGE
jgi:hypothetical protein